MKGKLKQRIVGAMVLLALAVIFLPRFFDRENEWRDIRVDAPPMPKAPKAPEQVSKPEAAQSSSPATSTEAGPTSLSQPLDAAGMPQAWSIQLASLSNRANAESLQQKLRSSGFKAYIRGGDGLNRVLVGPMIERTEAEQLLKTLNARYRVDGRVVQFKPEEN